MTEMEQSSTVVPALNTVSPAETTPQPATWAQRFLPLIVGALIIVLDQTTKYIIEANIPYNTSWAPVPSLAHIFQFTHTGNTGIAFGLFAGGSGLFAIVAFIVTLIILFYNYTLPAGNIGLRVVLGLLLGGALGNLIDRLRLGHVTDFLDFGPWPIFNVADTAVVAGALALGWLMWMESRQEARRAQETAESVHAQDE